jgi:predicted DNA-binding ribbon-helix-helix protein
MKPAKRSFTIAGHKTSISLEQAFWDALKDAATAKQLSVAELVSTIDKTRGAANLSSAVRVWILEHSQRQAKP